MSGSSSTIRIVFAMTTTVDVDHCTDRRSDYLPVVVNLELQLTKSKLKRDEDALKSLLRESVFEKKNPGALETGVHSVASFLLGGILATHPLQPKPTLIWNYASRCVASTGN